MASTVAPGPSIHPATWDVLLGRIALDDLEAPLSSHVREDLAFLDRSMAAWTAKQDARTARERFYYCVGCERKMPARYMAQTAHETDADPDLGYCLSCDEHDREAAR